MALQVTRSDLKLWLNKDFVAVVQIGEERSTSWGSEVRALYRPHHKAFRSNELRKAFFVPFCKEAFVRGFVRVWEANEEAAATHHASRFAKHAVQ